MAGFPMYAGVLELVDEADSKSVGLAPVWVRVPPPAPPCVVTLENKVPCNHQRNTPVKSGVFRYFGPIFVHRASLKGFCCTNNPFGRKRSRFRYVCEDSLVDQFCHGEWVLLSMRSGFDMDAPINQKSVSTAPLSMKKRRSVWFYRFACGALT